MKLRDIYPTHILIIESLRNYRRPILMTGSNPVHSGNKSIQIKSRRHHHPEIDQPGDDRRHIVVPPEPIPEYTPHDLELLHPSDRVFYDHSRFIGILDFNESPYLFPDILCIYILWDILNRFVIVLSSMYMIHFMDDQSIFVRFALVSSLVPLLGQ